MMRFCVSATLIALGLACASQQKQRVARTTEVVTFPDGAIVYYRGQSVGRAPARITLPQDTNGRLTERTEIRAVPNTAQPSLSAQTRILDPEKESDRIPDRIMIDMTLYNTNTAFTSTTALAKIEPRSAAAAGTNTPAKTPRPIERSKPTQAVGLDRWNPGIY